MQPLLDQILESTHLRVANEKRSRSFNELDREASYQQPPRDFMSPIRSNGISLIAEIKRRSPSRGAIKQDLKAKDLALAYSQGGAAALSVLTEPHFFGGSLADLSVARQACDLPVLRKDFIVDLYQVPEARAAGADAVLLIVAALPDHGLFKDLAAAIAQYKMSALVEIHEIHELDAAFTIEPSLIGINQRDLRTFEVDTSLAAKLRKQIPAEVAAVAESGIASRSDVIELQSAGLDAMLVGESLVVSKDPSAAARTLLGIEDAGH